MGYLLLPVAFRSLSRLSSALSAKASTLRSSSLNQRIERIILVQFRVHSVAHLSFVFVNYYFIVLSDDLGCLLLVYQEIFSVFGFQGSKRKTKSFPSGLKWTRTTDLTLIRRAL